MGDAAPQPDPTSPPAPARSPWRRIAKFFGLGLAILVLGPLLVVFLTTHIGDAIAAFTNPPPGEGIVVPEGALPDDDALATLVRLGEPIHRIFEALEKEGKFKDCGGLNTQRTLDWPCTEKLLQQAAGPMSAVDVWLAGPARYKLDRPANLDQHLRIQGVNFEEFYNAKIPNYLVFQSLGKALAYRALARWRGGDSQRAQHDLRTLFAVGAFLQQNPLLIGEMVGVAVHWQGLGVLVQHGSSRVPDSEFERMLPTPQQQMDGLRYAFHAEWRGVRDYVQHLGADQPWWELTAGSIGAPGVLPIPLQSALGWWSRADLQRLFDGYMRLVLAEVDGGRVADPGSPAREYWKEVCDSWRWLRDPIGRLMACNATPEYLQYVAKVRLNVDRVEATKVVLAARRFYKDRGRWPVEEKDLVPAYLEAWPVSALNGEPMRWREDKRGVAMLGEGGKTMCTEDRCQFLFDPPVPARPWKTGGKQVRQL